MIRGNDDAAAAVIDGRNDLRGLDVVVAVHHKGDFVRVLSDAASYAAFRAVDFLPDTGRCLADIRPQPAVCCVYLSLDFAGCLHHIRHHAAFSVVYRLRYACRCLADIRTKAAVCGIDFGSDFRRCLLDITHHAAFSAVDRLGNRSVRSTHQSFGNCTASAAAAVFSRSCSSGAFEQSGIFSCVEISLIIKAQAVVCRILKIKLKMPDNHCLIFVAFYISKNITKSNRSDLWIQVMEIYKFNIASLRQIIACHAKSRNVRLSSCPQSSLCILVTEVFSFANTAIFGNHRRKLDNAAIG